MTMREDQIQAAAKIICNQLVCNGDCVMTTEPGREKCNAANCRVFPVVEAAFEAAHGGANGEERKDRSRD